jgi:hypothetical protein
MLLSPNGTYGMSSATLACYSMRPELIGPLNS